MKNPKAPLILLVDDSEDARNILGASLEFAGFRVEEACDGQEGVEKAVRLSPAAVLLDLAMPKMDGFEAARLMKSNARTRGIPIIAVTAYGLPEWQERATKSGCDDFLQKPVHPEEIVRAVCRAMTRTDQKVTRRPSPPAC